MSLISVARNAARWLGFDLGRADGHVAQAVVVIDPATGQAGASGLTDAQLRATAVPVSLAATPGLTDTQLRAAAVVTTDSLGGTRAFNWGAGTRVAFTTTSTGALPIPTLGTSRELQVLPDARCFIRFGNDAVPVATVAEGQMIGIPDVPNVIRIPVGQTHYRVIGQSSSGNLSLTPVL